MAAGDDSVPVRARGLDTLEAAYAGWLELKLDHASALARVADERRRLEQQGSFLVGAVRAAKDLHPIAESATGVIVPRGQALGGFLNDAEEKLNQAIAELDRRARADDEAHRARVASARAELVERVHSFLARVRPKLMLRLRPVGTARTILHVDRPSPDEAVLLFSVFTGRIPSRYGFLFDDSTEEVRLPPATLYPDEGVAAGGIRPDALELGRVLAAATEVVPAKGHIPVPLRLPDGRTELFRLLARGPVLEVELAEGAAFRNVLTREEAERFAGYLVGLKLSGRVELEIQAD